MNDTTDTTRAQGAFRAQGKEAAAAPPDKEQFERVAEIMTRDLRRAQTEEYTRAARSHFTNAGTTGGGADHEQEGIDMLEQLSRKHTHEQIMFRGSINKLRAFYDKEREQTASKDRPGPQKDAKKSPDMGRGR